MPNHILNVWKIKNIPENKVEYLVNKLTRIYTTPGDDKKRIIDFDLIIPEPKYKQDCPKKFIRTEKDCVATDETKPWFNWYAWHCEYWDTKWNAYDGYTNIGKRQITLVFNTAWSFPYPIAEKLTELGYPLELKYADEDIGSNCGRYTYNPDTKDWVRHTESELTNPEKFARYLWDNY